MATTITNELGLLIEAGEIHTLDKKTRTKKLVKDFGWNKSDA